MKKNLFLSLFGVFLFFSSIQSQIDYDKVPEVTRTILINDVHIQKSPGVDFGLGDILIENGLIKQVAKQIEPPYNAKVVEADSAYAYPAFIDGLSYTSISKSEEKEERPKVKFKGFPPNDVAGITPEMSAKDAINYKEKSIKNMREAGFAISHVVPRGKMLPGQGCIISLHGDNSEDLLLQENVSQFFQFKGARPVFPSTTIAVMAKWRDLCKQSNYLSQYEDTYKQSALGMQRPKSDKTLTALIPVVKNKMPVFMNTPKVKDVFRALTLQKELGYKLVLSDVQQIMPALSKLKASGAMLLLSSKLPKTEKDKSKDKAAKDKPSKDEPPKEKGDMEKGVNEVAGVANERTGEDDKKVKPKKEKQEKVDDEETRMLKERKAKSLAEYEAQAAALEKAGIKFGFSMISGKPKELKDNLTRMIKAGLSEKGAWEALTTSPARILNIDKITGTLDNGKLANLFISDKPYFEEKSNIKFVFVEGEMTKIKSADKKKKSGGSGDGDMDKSLLGIWSYEAVIPGETNTGTMTISNDGELAVMLLADDTPDEEDEGTDVVADGSNLTFAITVDAGGMDMELTFDLEFSGDSFEGTVAAGAFGSFPISGSKTSSPE